MPINITSLKYRVPFGSINDDNTSRFVNFKYCITCVRVITK